MNDIELLVMISKLYFEEGLTQEKIANKLNITRLRVIEMLKRAKAEGIVRFQITNPQSDYARLQASLIQKYGLREVVIVPSFPHNAAVQRYSLGKAASTLSNKLRLLKLPEDVRELDDLANLPFTTKQDLRDSYPFGRLAVPLSQVVRIHASSGTTGKPTTVGYTRGDLDVWAECAARSLVSAGCFKEDIVQVAYGYGLFTGGLGLHYGAERLGASVIPTSSGNSQRQAMLMADFGTTTICCTPSFALYMIDVLDSMGIDALSLSLKRGVFGAEPWTAAMREQIEKRLGIDAFDIYGLSEVMGPGVSMECIDKSGMHIYEDHFYPEIIDPDTLAPLPPGISQSSLLLSTLSKCHWRSTNGPSLGGGGSVSRALPTAI